MTEVKCPKCDTSFQGSSDIGEELYSHIVDEHLACDVAASCPICNNDADDSGPACHKILKQFTKHLEDEHDFTVAESAERTGSATDGNRSLPKIGDKVLCKYGGWQYFDATILEFDRQKLEYYIEWDDQDPEGRHIYYQDLAMNKPPEENLIGIGTVVLFHQGQYGANAEIGRLAGVRWHQGIITRIETDDEGKKLYSGEHTKGEVDGKWVTYGGYNESFTHYRQEDLRMGPNVFDLVGEQEDNTNFNTDCDVYLSYCPNDSQKDVKSGYGKAKFTSDQYAATTDPLKIKADLEEMGYKVLSNIRNNFNNELDLKKIVSCIRNCKVFISCISDDYAESDHTRMEMQYVRNSAKKPLIPVVLGAGGWNWKSSVVGMIIAGERYIDFKKIEFYDEKLDDLRIQLQSLIGDAEEGDSEEDQDKSKDVFISYCWTNSYLSKEANQVPTLSGTEFSDPRKIKEILEERYGFNVWLDIEQLTSGQQTGMFEQISDGLLNSKVVCAFVSTEYARSVNCKMEFQFATKSLYKPFIPIVVGETNDWESTVIGAIVVGSGKDPISLLQCNSYEELNGFLDNINELIKEHTKEEDEDESKKLLSAAVHDGRKQRAPVAGDHVISHHFKHAYFTATILEFIKDEMSYKIKWDDGDPTGRVQKYDMVALNIEPEDDELGVGQRIFFPQGKYKGTEGNNTGGMRYHEGIIDSYEVVDGVKRYSGHHLRGEEDNKWVTYLGYGYEFRDLTKSDLRVAPNAMDVLMSSRS